MWVEVKLLKKDPKTNHMTTYFTDGYFQCDIAPSRNSDFSATYTLPKF